MTRPDFKNNNDNSAKVEDSINLAKDGEVFKVSKNFVLLVLVKSEAMTSKIKILKTVYYNKKDALPFIFSYSGKNKNFCLISRDSYVALCEMKKIINANNSLKEYPLDLLMGNESSDFILRIKASLLESFTRFKKKPNAKIEFTKKNFHIMKDIFRYELYNFMCNSGEILNKQSAQNDSAIYVNLKNKPHFVLLKICGEISTNIKYILEKEQSPVDNLFTFALNDGGLHYILILKSVYSRIENKIDLNILDTTEKDLPSIMGSEHDRFLQIAKNVLEFKIPRVLDDVTVYGRLSANFYILYELFDEQDAYLASLSRLLFNTGRNTNNNSLLPLKPIGSIVSTTTMQTTKDEAIAVNALMSLSTPEENITKVIDPARLVDHVYDVSPSFILLKFSQNYTVNKKINSLKRAINDHGLYFFFVYEHKDKIFCLISKDSYNSLIKLNYLSPSESITQSTLKNIMNEDLLIEFLDKIRSNLSHSVEKLKDSKKIDYVKKNFYIMQEIVGETQYRSICNGSNFLSQLLVRNIGVIYNLIGIPSFALLKIDNNLLTQQTITNLENEIKNYPLADLFTFSLLDDNYYYLLILKVFYPKVEKTITSNINIIQDLTEGYDFKFSELYNCFIAVAKMQLKFKISRIVDVNLCSQFIKKYSQLYELFDNDFINEETKALHYKFEELQTLRAQINNNFDQFKQYHPLLIPNNGPLNNFPIFPPQTTQTNTSSSSNYPPQMFFSFTQDRQPISMPRNSLLEISNTSDLSQNRGKRKANNVFAERHEKNQKLDQEKQNNPQVNTANNTSQTLQHQTTTGQQNTQLTNPGKIDFLLNR